jgi:hypothetical protein
MATKTTTAEVYPLNIKEKLTCIQSELKAPKDQYNSFGKYSYRNAEDIQKALKPLEKKYNVATIIFDTVEAIGGRIYVKATARLIDCESDEFIETTAYAREAETKKGMDDAQVTGATSSYARKYALNGLFMLDDTKDVDSEEYQKQKQEAAKQQAASAKPVQEKAPAPAEVKKAETPVDPERKKRKEAADKLVEYCKANDLNINDICAANNLNQKSTAQDFEMALVYARTIILTGGNV